jgi:hypothetical protein
MLKHAEICRSICNYPRPFPGPSLSAPNGTFAPWPRNHEQHYQYEESRATTLQPRSTTLTYRGGGSKNQDHDDDEDEEEGGVVSDSGSEKAYVGKGRGFRNPKRNLPVPVTSQEEEEEERRSASLPRQLIEEELKNVRRSLSSVRIIFKSFLFLFSFLNNICFAKKKKALVF